MWMENFTHFILWYEMELHCELHAWADFIPSERNCGTHWQEAVWNLVLAWTFGKKETVLSGYEPWRLLTDG